MSGSGIDDFQSVHDATRWRGMQVAAELGLPLLVHAENDVLTAALAGDVAFIASNHSPAPASMKGSANFFEVWGGISGCQTSLGLMLEEDHARRRMPLPHLAALTAGAAARRFGLAGRGRHPVNS